VPGATLLNRDDPIYEFEHMMQHREYFAIMGSRDQGLSGFSVLPYVLDPGIGTTSPAQNWNQNHQQAHDDYNGDLPDNSNDGFTVELITPPTVTGNLSAAPVPPATSTTTVTLAGLTHSIIIGSSMTAAVGVPAGTFITGQISGPPGGNGTYTISQPVLAMTNNPVTITHPPFEQATKVEDQGAFGIHQAGILIEGDGQTPENRTWWTFVNHTQHLIANDIVLPLPTTAPTTAGTGPGQAPVSNPWWWIDVEVTFPFW